MERFETLGQIRFLWNAAILGEAVVKLCRAPSNSAAQIGIRWDVVEFGGAI